jgi:hypothetical protein
MRATISLATEQVSLLEELPYRRFELGVVALRGRRPGNDYDVNVLWQQLAVLAVYFADVALDAVSHHGPAHFARYGAPHFPSLACLPDPIANDRRPDVFFAVFVDV